MTKSAARRKDKLSKKINKANVKGKTKRATRLAKRQDKIVKTGKRGAGRTIDKAKKLGKKVASSRVGIVAKGLYDTYKSAKKGNVSGVAKAVKGTAKALKDKKKKVAMSVKPKLSKKVKGFDGKAKYTKAQVDAMSSLDRNRYLYGRNTGSRSGSYKGIRVPQVGKTVKGSVKKIKMSMKAKARKTSAASKKIAKAAAKDVKRNKLASELKKKLGAKKYETLRTKKLKGLSAMDRKKVSEINRLYKSAARKRGAAKRKMSKVNKK